MYNLIISGNDEAWDGDLYEFPIERLFGYTEENVKLGFVTPTDSSGGFEIDFKKLSKLVTVLAYEKSVGKPAKVVYISDLRKFDKNVKFRADSLINLNSDFDIYNKNIAFDLDIDVNSWQISRTHWAVKEVDLNLVLIKHSLLADVATPLNFASHQNTTKNFARTNNSEIFIVHGHDEAMKQSVARFIEKAGLKPVILSEQADHGRTVIEKFEQYASQSAFAIVLLSPDDFGGISPTDLHRRARQNVILELGYFIGSLGRINVCAIKHGEVELPSDIFGVVWKLFDSSDGWKLSLYRELKAAGLSPNEAALH